MLQTQHRQQGRWFVNFKTLIYLYFCNYHKVYLRFITQYVNENDQTQRGFFNAMDYIQNRLSTSDEDKEKLDAIYNWFKKNLDAPEWFTKPEYRAHEYHSVSWFKDSAKEHILKIQEAIEILENYDLIVERVTSKLPGRIMFEDKYQISAVPFSKKRKTVLKELVNPINLKLNLLRTANYLKHLTSLNDNSQFANIT